MSDKHPMSLRLRQVVNSMPAGQDTTTVLKAASELDRQHKLLNTPEVKDFARAVVLEAAHQVQRWGEWHDRAKKPEDWFWLIGYLAGKALAAAKTDDPEQKALHH